MPSTKDQGPTPHRTGLEQESELERERRIESLKPDQQDKSNLGGSGSCCSVDDIAAVKEEERES